MNFHPIVRLRRLKGWRQADLADYLEVSMNTIQRWEKGALPRPKAFRELAEALDVTPAELDREIREWATQQGEPKAAA